jgi:hypothetical protein
MLKTKKSEKSYSARRNVEYGELSPRSQLSIYEILASLSKSSDKIKNQAVTVDSEENSFRISIGDHILASGGVKILCGGKRYTTVLSEIVPAEKLKGKPPVVYLLKFEPMKVESKLLAEEAQVERYSLKSSDDVVDASITFQNLKKFGQIIVRLEFNKALEGTSTGNYETPCVELFYINRSNLSRVVTFVSDEYPKPTTLFDAVEGPIMFFNDNLETLIVGPMENPHLFFGYSEKRDPTKHHFGIEGLVERIPEKFVFELLFLPGKGIIKSWLEFGDRFLLLHERPHRNPAYGSVSQNYLGYSTMEGAAYYEKTEKELDILQTLMLVKEEANLLEIPYLYYALGTWFYPKKDGLLKWDANQEDIPGGITNLQESLQSGIISALSWFSFNNVYKTMSDKWIEEVVIEKKKETKRCLPLAPEVWEEILQTSKKWNCYVLQFEDLSEIWSFFSVLKKNVYLFKEFIQLLSDVCIKHEFKVIVSKTPVALIPFFSVYAPVIQAVSCENDSLMCACPEKHKKAITSSLLFWTFGLWPTKNAVFSMKTGHERSKNVSKVPEPLDMLISSLTGGAIALGDKVGSQNAEIILQACREDGLLLKPDRPLLPIELMFLSHNKPFISSTFTINSGNVWHYVLAMKIDDDLATDVYYTLNDLGINEGKWVYYDYFDKLVIPIEYDSKLCGYEHYNQLKKAGDYHYAVIAPIHSNGIAFVGLRDKFITVPSGVIQSIQEIADGLVIKGTYCLNKDFSVVFYSEHPPKSILFNGTPLMTKWGEYYKTVTLTMWLTDSEQFEIIFKI